MSDDRRLLAYALGLLPRGARDELESRLAADPALAARARMVQQEVAGVPHTPPAWLLPLPGQHRGRVPIRATAQVDAWMDAGPGRLRPVSITLDLPSTMRDRRLVLLREHQGTWTVQEPHPGAAPRRVRDLPQDDERPRLDLLLASSEPEEWSLVLLPDDLAPGLTGGDQRALREVRQAVADLRCDAVTVRIG